MKNFWYEVCPPTVPMEAVLKLPSKINKNHYGSQNGPTIIDTKTCFLKREDCVEKCR